MKIKISMEKVNKMDQSQFINIVGAVFEHSPWVAEKSWNAHPFVNLEQMYNHMIEEMHGATTALKLSLLRAHPDLGTRLEVSESSRDEQKNAGLSQLSEQEFEEFSMLNKDYINKFGFPFIMAVKGQSKKAIKSNMKARIHNSYEEEFETALQQVSKIARFRLWDLILEKELGKLTTHVLDISTGKPAQNVVIELWKRNNDNHFVKIGQSRTNSDGRVPEPLLEANEMKKGTYQIRFNVGDYYRSKLEKEPYFLEIVPIQFVITKENEHYHVPLLIAPGGYSTYRGS
ncbi:2-oxo-4-hydroxy-4-carboxy-5-ureidoimidazoline decarboxylase [Halalkalibacter flavus]|uniref:2-oxo-4-hydroxy-4-carboxy-5-ureidoimidazoline decarboxylase n=1 Tax=Halalkalibacter flavus TaxID=3090668 RepID=UPI002FC58266